MNDWMKYSIKNERKNNSEQKKKHLINGTGNKKKE